MNAREFDYLQDALKERSGLVLSSERIQPRKMLICFDRETGSGVRRRVSRMPLNDGVLYLGGAESILGISRRPKPLPSLRGVHGLLESEFDAPAAIRSAAS